jgi:hypothetical protein
MSPTELVPWFQMGSTVLTGIGIIVSVSLGIASLNNNRRDRLAKIRPDLLFNIGGQEVAARLEKLTTVPGLDQNDPGVVGFVTTLPTDQKCIVLSGRFGQLYNHGAGTAYETYIWFDPDRIISSGVSRRLTTTQQRSPPYAKGWNSIAATPANVPPEGAAFFGIVPASVYLVGADVSEVSGEMRIECRDIDGRSVQSTQPVTFFVDRLEGDKASVTISFGRRLLYGNTRQ